MYNVYGIYTDTYREACLIAGADHPDDLDGEQEAYEFAEYQDAGGKLSFEEWNVPFFGPPQPWNDIVF